MLTKKAFSDKICTSIILIGTLILYQYSTFILKFQVYSNINTKIGSLKSTLFLNRVKCSWGHKCNY